MIEITQSKINIDKLIAHVNLPSAGGIDVFIGTTRDQTKGKQVLRLDFEAYEPMAIKELQKIADRACRQWDILAYAISHRVGTVHIGEEAVAIAVSSPHRKAAFEACQFIIDELKVSVPIWKKEYFEDGDVWVAAHP